MVNTLKITHHIYYEVNLPVEAEEDCDCLWKVTFFSVGVISSSLMLKQCSLKI